MLRSDCQPPYAHTRAGPALNKTLSLSLSFSITKASQLKRLMLERIQP